MKMDQLTRWLPLALLASSLGCGAEDPGGPTAVPAEARAEAPAVDLLALAEAAVASPNRPDADRADDADRRPAEVVAFFQIAPGMRVLDLLCGSGYYSEILAGVVGAEGEVVCQTNKPYVDFLGNAWGERWAEGRLPNVVPLEQEMEDLDLEPGSFDAIVFVLGYHDTYAEPGDGSWPVIDNDRLLAELSEALRPGGVFGIVDHAAALGGDPIEVATTLHRIDESVVKDDLAAAGFVLEAEADFLRNPDDDKSVDPFRPQTRRKTDRFILRFRKPDA